MNKYNIVWGLVDSVRKYHSDDDRTRLDFMDEFSEESIEIKNIVTSAPSTIMSISSMMTSLPAYYLGRNYSDFRFDREYFTTLSSILSHNSWTTNALIMLPEIREKLKVLNHIPRKYWPRGFSHRDSWDNLQINQLLRNALEVYDNEPPQPCFWFLDFNCREDPDTSDIVKDSFEQLKKAGYDYDNTIYILCSDHGYPDPSSGVTPKALADQKLTHDIFMTDDKITIPFFIRYPGSEEGKKIETTVSTLDIMPTIIDILGLDVEPKISELWHGKSLINLIEKNETKDFASIKVRTDARFFGQEGRVTAIRGDDYKYVYYHDQGIEEFFDVSEFNIIEEDIASLNDPLIQSNMDHFREVFKETEEAGKKFQTKYALYKLKQQTKNIKLRNILIISNEEHSYLELLSDSFNSIFPEANLDLISTKGFKQITGIRSQFNFKLESLNSVQLPSFAYDLVLTTYDSSKSDVFQNLEGISKKIKSKNKYMIDLNMTMSIRSGQIMRYIRTVLENKEFYIQEPSLIFYLLVRTFRLGINYISNFFRK